MPRWSLDDVARMRLLSQRLIDPLDDPAAVVRHLTCTQAQDLPGSTTSIALRTTSRRLGDVHAAYDSGDIVRSWPMRGTLFAVAADDLRWMLGLTAERMIASTAKRRAELEISDADLDTASAVATQEIPAAGLSREDLLEAFEKAGQATSSGRGYHLIFALALRGLICQGPTATSPSGAVKQLFVLSDAWLPDIAEVDRETAVAEWFTRYVRSHGPAPDAEFLWWTKLLRRDLAPVLDHACESLASIEVDGVTHWLDPEVSESYGSAKRATAAPLLLPGFDEIVLGYGDRAAVMTAEQEREHIVPGKNGVFRPTVIHAGRAVGTWRRAKREADPVEVTHLGDALPGAALRAVPRLSAALPR